MTISNQDDVIDSRDLIARIEELEAELLTEFNDHSNAVEGQEDEEVDADNVRFINWVEETENENTREYLALKAFAAEASQASDYGHGETLIRESYFTTYIEEIVNDCYEMPKELKKGGWPYNHITIDWEGAADEAKSDYSEAEFDGVTYLFRS